MEPQLGYHGELTLGGLTNLRARDYQASTGVFTSVDPLADIPATTTSGNPYHFAYNNPTNLSDPSGLQVYDCNIDLPFGKCFSAENGWDTFWVQKEEIALNAITLGGYGIYTCTTDFLEGVRDDDLQKALIGGACVVVSIAGIPSRARAATALSASARAAATRASTAAGLTDDLLRTGGATEAAASADSTGRTVAGNLTEQMAMEEVVSSPAGQQLTRVVMSDAQWPAADGWVKMSQNVNGVEIHYVFNTVTKAVDDFKFIGGGG